MKFDEGKPKVHLVYPSAIYEMAKVREYGYNKHGSLNGWKTTPSIQHYDACLRHIFSAMHGEKLDPDSNLKHLSHALCNLMFLIEEENEKELGTWSKEVDKAKKSMDGRYNKKEEKGNENNSG